MKLRALHPAADQEYTAAAQYYTRISAELGGRFYDEMERLICDISSQPDRVWVVAMMHFKRRPGYWQQRLPK